MHHRRPKAVAAPVLGLLLAASLSACGFHYPTDRVNTISAGENNRTSSLDALGMRILASGPGQGRLIGSFANESTSAPATVTSVAVPAGGITVGKFTPIKLLDGGAYNLANETSNPITLSGDFEPGQVVMGVQITFTLQGQPNTITMNVPVVKNCYWYSEVPTPTPSASASAKGGTKGGTKGATATASAAASASASPTGDSSAFDCTAPSPSEAPAE